MICLMSVSPPDITAQGPRGCDGGEGSQRTQEASHTHVPVAVPPKPLFFLAFLNLGGRGRGVGSKGQPECPA